MNIVYLTFVFVCNFHKKIKSFNYQIHLTIINDKDNFLLFRKKGSFLELFGTFISNNFTGN